ncbi:MAG: hypothetical protein JO340_12880 [Acidobacteriaceae bacterium]|nr:hypothetical protein [Acidobacteriaceae bacterium]
MLTPDSQVLLSIGVPTVVILIGMLVNMRQIERLEKHMDSQFVSVRMELNSLRSEMNARFEAAHQALLRVEGVMDARLKHLEERE